MCLQKSPKTTTTTTTPQNKVSRIKNSKSEVPGNPINSFKNRQKSRELVKFSLDEEWAFEPT